MFSEFLQGLLEVLYLFESIFTTPTVRHPTKNPTRIVLSKQQAIDTNPKKIQQINFTGNLDRPEGAIMFFYY